MLIDSHHHLWIYNPIEYNWIDNSMKILKRNFLPEDLAVELHNSNVSGTVVVQARQTLEETQWLLELTSKDKNILGVIGWIDLRSEMVRKQITMFAEYPKLRGVRHVLQDEPDISFMLHPAFQRGIGLLSEYNLTYDLLIFPKHLKYAFKLAKCFPNQKFVLDHISKPPIKAGIIDPWRKDLFTLAKLPNVHCKISGIVTEADHGNWNYEEIIPYLSIVTEAFSPDRLMIGSDWPVCLLSSDYETVMNIPKRFYSSFSEDEKKKIFYTNCIDFYSLKDPLKHF